MKVIQTDIPDVVMFQPRVFGDTRGYFCETFRQDVFEKYIGSVNFVQDNESMSSYGVLRGLHFQKPPYTQSKLVRAVKGKVLDVVVDIRIGSPTYGQYVSVELSEENRNMLWSPKGFAHGYCVLSETAIFSYKVDAFYAPDYDAGMQWNDPEINIDWKIPSVDIKLSEKDKSHPSFQEVKDFSFEQFKKENLYPMK
jgi:dTDP-4-dehydrorhamnose 3,5-epimerase